MTTESPAGASIPTPDQRLRVFVSSTLGELADERVAVSRGARLNQQGAAAAVRDHRNPGPRES